VINRAASRREEIEAIRKRLTATAAEFES